MTEEEKSQPLENQLPNVEFDETLVEEKKEVVFRHPQQILTNKEIQILLAKKNEELNDLEKDAIKLFLIRAKHHNSRPLKVLSKKQNKLKKQKRRTAKKSRKTNR
jgi:hypothetical protein